MTNEKTMQENIGEIMDTLFRIEDALQALHRKVWSFEEAMLEIEGDENHDAA